MDDFCCERFRFRFFEQQTGSAIDGFEWFCPA
jgi:hypothetical protein